jgi:hypothetical protein
VRGRSCSVALCDGRRTLAVGGMDDSGKLQGAIWVSSELLLQGGVVPGGDKLTVEGAVRGKHLTLSGRSHPGIFWVC